MNCQRLDEKHSFSSLLAWPIMSYTLATLYISEMTGGASYDMNTAVTSSSQSPYSFSSSSSDPINDRRFEERLPDFGEEVTKKACQI